MSASTVMPMPGNDQVAASLAAALGTEVGRLAVRRFPDGESYVRVESNVEDRHVIVLATLRDPDPQFLPLAYLARALRESGAASVGLVAPYLAYMRQDRRFHPGEALTSVEFARLLSERFDWLVTVDPHLHRFKTLSAVYPVPAKALHCGPLLAEWVKTIERPVLIGPDSESEQWVSAIASRAAAPFVVLDKTRLGDRSVQIKVPDLTRWRDHTPVLVDDIISSAHTLIAALRGWPADAPRPLCLGIHAVFAPGAQQELEAERPRAIVTTNTIPHSSNRIDVVPLLAEGVRSAWAEGATRPSADAAHAP